MMEAGQLIQALHAGTRVYGTLLVSPSPKWMDIVKTTGLDFVWIDMEHIPLDINQLSWMCQGYKAQGLAPIVRIPESDPYQASRVIDAGASGVIAPYVETPEQVIAMRGAVKLRPLKGKKLHDILTGQIQPDPKLAEYLEDYNKDHILMAMIESVPSLDALDDILDVPGLDAVMIGPHDLTASLGIPEQYDHPLFDNAVREVIKKARAKKVGAGVHFWPSVEQEIAWAQAGLNMISHHSDMMLFAESITDVISRLRAALCDDTGAQMPTA